MAKIRDNQERARMAQIWIKISMGVYVATIPYILYAIDITTRGGYPTQQEIAIFGLASVVMVIVGLGTFIGSAVTFIQWFRRSYYNLHQLTGGLSYTEGWAAGAWFVPIFNLFGPYQIAKEIVMKSEKLLGNDPFDKKPSNLLQTIGLWWGFWIASGVINRLDIVMRDNPNLELYFSLIASALGIIAGIFVLKFIKSYSEIEIKLRNLDPDETAPIIDGSDLLDSTL